MEIYDRWQLDRKQMIAALRDYKSGKMDHLPAQERETTIECIHARLATLDELIAGKHDA